ncbi:MAG: hypothetical protein LBG87_02150 [Spirochaetaceae bacterium]|jgi:hypothetical protein|nr:hypothetical protein [Spirochaetaceae bacterium]
MTSIFEVYAKSKELLERAEGIFAKAKSHLAKARYALMQTRTASRCADYAKRYAEGVLMQAYMAASVGALLEEIQGDTVETEAFQAVAEYAAVKAVCATLCAQVVALRYEASVRKAQAASDKADAAMRRAESIIARADSIIEQYKTKQSRA